MRHAQLIAALVLVASTMAQAQQRFVIERDIPGASKMSVGSSRVDLQACKLEYSIVSPK